MPVYEQNNIQGTGWAIGGNGGRGHSAELRTVEKKRTAQRSRINMFHFYLHHCSPHNKNFAPKVPTVEFLL